MSDRFTGWVRRAVAWVLAVVAAVAANGRGVAAALPSAKLSAPVVFAQLPIDGGQAAGEAAGGRSGRIVRVDPGGELRVLTDGFSDAGALDVSFDGERILFAGRRGSGEGWNIWEMKSDGSGVRRITRDLGQCRSPAYQSTLYTIVSTEPWYQIMFVSDGAGAFNETGSGPAWNLYSCRLDGSAVRRLTFNLSDDLDPCLSADGRVLLASGQRMDLRRGGRGRMALFGVNADGTDYALFAGDEGRRFKRMPCATSDGRVVFVESDRLEGDGSGSLASVTMRRNLHSYRSVTSPGDGLYHSPAPLPDGNTLVSRRPADGGGSHGLYRLDPTTGKAVLLFDDPAYHDVHGRLLAARRKPDGRSSVVDEKVDWGKLYCLNVHLTDPGIRGHVRPGMIRELRVIEGVPRLADRAAVAGLAPVVQKRLLGIVPIEADGSFQVEIPPDTPIQLQRLDENGLALRTCGWIWAKPREPRGCIGCHEDPELTPENVLVEAVKKPGVNLRIPVRERRTVDFRRDVMEIIARRCSSTDCHGGDDAELKLGSEGVGPFNQAYVNLMAGVRVDPESDDVVVGKYVHPGQARTSLLIHRLMGGDTSRPRDGAAASESRADLPLHPEDDTLTDEERMTFVEWIDLGAHWDGIPGESR